MFLAVITVTDFLGCPHYQNDCCKFLLNQNQVRFDIKIIVAFKIKLDLIFLTVTMVDCREWQIFSTTLVLDLPF